MFRKSNGSVGFSWNRLITNAVPNFASDSGGDDISSARKDMLYAHQTASSNPTSLDELSFYVAGVTDNESFSRRAHKALLKNGVLRPTTAADGVALTRLASQDPDGSVQSRRASTVGTGASKMGLTIDTTRITRQFVHQLAFLSVSSQRTLISVLFWWEEEVHRLRKLAAEEAELDAMIQDIKASSSSSTTEDSHRPAAADGDDDSELRREELGRLEFARERLRMKVRQRPSQRDTAIEEDRDDIAMAWHGRRKSEVEAKAGELPPAYMKR